MYSPSLLWWPTYSSVLWGQTDPDWFSLRVCGNEQALHSWTLLYSKNYGKIVSPLVLFGVDYEHFICTWQDLLLQGQVYLILPKFLHTSTDLSWRRSSVVFIVNLSETWSPWKDYQEDCIPLLDVFMDMGAQLASSVKSVKAQLL